MKKAIFISTSLLTLLFASCSNNPETRIKNNPAIYSALSQEHQGLVSEGQIERGMSKPAVFLAMGKADREHLSVQKDKSIERWIYNTLQPVYRSSFELGYGRYRGYSNRRGRYGYGQSIGYVPRVGSTVSFENEEVTGWTGIKR